jgi:hypothetical protein
VHVLEFNHLLACEELHPLFDRLNDAGKCVLDFSS